MRALIQAMSQPNTGHRRPGAAGQNDDEADDSPEALAARRILFRQLLGARGTVGTLGKQRERTLVRIVAAMLKSRVLPGSQGLNESAYAVRARALLLTDWPLAAFWLSVSRGGDSAWDEEISRVRRLHAADVRKLPPQERFGVNSDGSVAALMPLYRQWGQLVLDANATPDIQQLADDALAAWEAL